MLFVVLFVVLLSIVASSQWFTQAGRFLKLAQLSASGLIFVVIGAVMGPHVLAWLSAQSLLDLRPVIAVGLGVGGLLMGLNLDPSLVRSLPMRVFSAVSIQSGLTFLVVAAPLTFPLFLLGELNLPRSIGAAGILGAVASVSSAHFAIIWYRAGRLSRATSLSVALLATLDDLVALVGLVLALIFGSATSASIGLGLVAAAIVLGLSCGALLAFLLRGGSSDAERIAILLGGVALVSGAAAYLRVSTLLAGFACGATLSLVGGTTTQLAYRSLARVERPAFLVLAFLVGAHVTPYTLWGWALLPVFVLCRTVGKVLGGRAAKAVARDTLSLPADPGYALLAQGGLSICVAIEYLLLVRHASAEIIFDVAVLGALVNEILAGSMFGRALRREGDLEAPPSVGTAV